MPDPSQPTIRAAVAAAVESSPDLAENPLMKFLQTMTPEQESVAEHLIELDRKEIQAELERLQAEESAA